MLRKMSKVRPLKRVQRRKMRPHILITADSTKPHELNKIVNMPSGPEQLVTRVKAFA